MLDETQEMMRAGMFRRGVEDGAIKRLRLDKTALLLQAEGGVETFDEIDHGMAPTRREAIGKPRARKTAAQINALKEVWRNRRQVLPGRFRRWEAF
jgi:hypothetical protein